MRDKMGTDERGGRKNKKKKALKCSKRGKAHCGEAGLD